MEGHASRMLEGLSISQAIEESRKSQISKYDQQAGLPGGSINLSEGNTRFFADSTPLRIDHE